MAEPEQNDRPTGSSAFSDFIRNATPEEKAVTYQQIMEKVVKQQQAVINSVPREAATYIRGGGERMSELPELPQSLTDLFNGDRATCDELRRQITSYALAAVQMEREKMAAQIERTIAGWDWPCRNLVRSTVVAAIRSPAKEGEAT